MTIFLNMFYLNKKNMLIYVSITKRLCLPKKKRPVIFLFVQSQTDTTRIPFVLTTTTTMRGHPVGISYVLPGKEIRLNPMDHSADLVKGWALLC